MRIQIRSSVEPLQLMDTLLHRTGNIEAHEASYNKQVFLNYTINTETNVLVLSTVRTVQASRGQGLAKGALQWLCNLADTHNMSIALTAQPLSSGNGEGLSEANLVKFYVKFGFEKRGQIKGKTGFHQLMVREAK